MAINNENKIFNGKSNIEIDVKHGKSNIEIDVKYGGYNTMPSTTIFDIFSNTSIYKYYDISSIIQTLLVSFHFICIIMIVGALVSICKNLVVTCKDLLFH